MIPGQGTRSHMPQFKDPICCNHQLSEQEFEQIPGDREGQKNPTVLQSLVLQRVRHDLATEQQCHNKENDIKRNKTQNKNCSLSGSSVHGISQARLLEWVATSFSRGSSLPRDQTHVSCLAGKFFTTEPLGNPKLVGYRSLKNKETSFYTNRCDTVTKTMAHQ